MTKTIILNTGDKVIIDDEDYGFLSQWKWQRHKLGYAVRTGYLAENKRFIPILMHRIILNVPKGRVTDHINGDKLDNRRCNLRICTQSQNQQNQKTIRKGTSKYKGVSWNKEKEKWQAFITINGKSVNLGTYNSEAEAANIYNKFAKKYFNEFAKVNVI